MTMAKRVTVSRPDLGQESDQIAALYKENGYLVLEDAFTREQVQSYCQETLRITRGERGPIDGLLPVDPGDNDDEILDRYVCLHKVHKISEVMHRQLAHESIVSVLTAIIGPNVKSCNPCSLSNLPESRDRHGIRMRPTFRPATAP